MHDGFSPYTQALDEKINEMDEEDERRSLKQQKQEKFMGQARLAAARKLGIMINVSNCNRWIFIFLLLRS